MITATEERVGTQLSVIVHVRASLVRISLASVLEADEGVKVVGSTFTNEDLVSIVDAEQPDAVVYDAGDTATDLATTIGAIKTVSPRTAILVIANGASIGMVESALRAGATGFTLWDITPNEFRAALASVARGDGVLHPKAAALAGARLRGDDPTQLTPRQTEILTLLTDGLPNKQIARRLGIAVETVKTHLERIFDRLEVNSRTEAVAVAMRQGVV